MIAAAATKVAPSAPASASPMRPRAKVSERSVKVPRRSEMATRVAATPTKAPARNQNKMMRPSRAGSDRTSERRGDNTREPPGGNDVSPRRQPVSKQRQKRRRKQAI